MHRNIDEVLKRGETLEALMAKSKDLSSVSYGFYKKAKKNNQCCKLY
jgi:synaptobrevin family protein YKT6